MSDALTNLDEHADGHDTHDHAENGHEHGALEHFHYHGHEQIGFESWGVELSISAPPQILPAIERVLPPAWRPRQPSEDDHQFVVHMHNHEVFRVRSPGRSVTGSSDLQIALEVLDARLRNYIALHAPDHVFVHAGVVGYGGRAILLPGPSFSGKTTLVTELLRAGATYYSDEFAVLDGEGLVHAYPKPLSVRLEGVSQVEHDIESFGAAAGDKALPVGLVAICQYGPGAVWNPRELSPGEAVLALLSNTVPAQERPQQSLSALKRALEGAVVVQGERGAAPEVAADLLRRMRPAT